MAHKSSNQKKGKLLEVQRILCVSRSKMKHETRQVWLGPTQNENSWSLSTDAIYYGVGTV